MADEKAIAPSGSKTTFDIATVAGIVGGFALIITAIILGGAPLAFVDIPSVLIVILGTIAITTASFTLQEMLRTVTVIMRTIVYPVKDPSAVATQMLQVAETARKNGVLGLQGAVMDALRGEPFLFKGLSMVVDGTPGEEVEVMMRREVASTIGRHQKATGVLRRAGEVSPAMGLIGTLIGLVQMLGQLDDPAAIGPAMAVALLTTFYGAILANMVFLPLAAKLDRNSGEEAMVNQLYTMSVISIAKQENPRRLEMLLNSILPPAKRIKYFD